MTHIPCKSTFVNLQLLIMLDQSFGLLFYLKKPKNYTRGPIPINLRITVDGIPKEISVKRDCEPSKWNSKANRAVGNKEEIKSLNQYLDAFENKVYNIKRQLFDKEIVITAAQIKAELQGKAASAKANTHSSNMMVAIFQSYLEKVQKLIGKDYSKATFTKYERTCRYLQAFIKHQTGEQDCSLDQITLNFIEAFEVWLKTEKDCCHNTSMKYLSIFSMVIKHCYDSDFISKNPFSKFQITFDEVVPEFLLYFELQKIMEKQFHTPRLRQIRDAFVFCCYTGLSYIDIQRLSRSDIAKGVDGKLWIFIKRGKTSTPSHVPLLPFPLQILRAYENHPDCLRKDRVLPIISNQKYNEYLKEIADLAGITKILTTHTARHTFATTVTLCNDVPLETVSKMLGHKKIQTTLHYAKVLDIKVSKDMLELEKKLTTGACDFPDIPIHNSLDLDRA